MPRRWPHIGVSIALLLTLGGPGVSAASAEPDKPPAVRLHQGLDSVQLDRAVLYARAPHGLSPAEIHDLDWHPSPGVINLGFTRDDVWVRIRLHNEDGPERWFLQVAFPLIHHIELYEAPDRPPLITGMGMRFHQRPVRARDFVLPIVVPRGAERELLLRAHSEDTLQLPLSLWRPEAYHAAARLEAWGLGLYYGLALVMIVYHLLLFIRIRDRSYLYYGAHIFSFAIFSLSQLGLAYELLWPESPWWALCANTLLAGVTVLFAAQFARTFLELEKRAPGLNTALRIIQAACIVQIAVSLSGAVALTGVAASVLAVAFVVTAFAASVVCLRRGFAPARLYLLAFVALFASGAAYAMKAVGVLPNNFITDYGMLLGSAAEIVLLSWAVANRIHQLEKERTRALESRLQLLESFSLYVPRQFLQELGRASIEQVVRGDAVEREMTILFTDIRGFTSMAERMRPEETFDFLNQYLEAMSPPINRNGGFVDKFIGDAIMALFPGPADDALRAALELSQALDEFNRARGEHAPVRAGIGLNRGRVVLGTVGSSSRLSTTVVGDAVNLASRIEGVTKLYQAPIILTGAVRDALADPEAFRLRELDAVLVRGKSEPVVLYHAYDAEATERIEALDAIQDEHRRGLALYREGRFAEAELCFQRCLDRHDGDATARLYVERCRGFTSAPPRDWTGVSNLERGATHS